MVAEAMVVEVPMVVAHHIVAVVHLFQVAVDHLAVEDPAADGNQKDYTTYNYPVDDDFIIIIKCLGFSRFDGASC